MNTVTKFALIIVTGISVSACSGSKTGPDEFGVVPNKPLIIPEDLAALPEPNKSVRNRADQVPLEDAVVALGGDSDRLNSTSINTSDQALLATTGRFGNAGNIRAITAQEDLQYRENNKPRILERLAGGDYYIERYEKQSLDSNAELLRLRRLGVRTPSAPPPGLADN